MTIKEALIEEIGIPALTNAKRVEKALIDFKLAGDAEYVLGDELFIAVKRAAVDVLSSIRGVDSIKEGDFTITLSQVAINARLGILARETGNKDLQADMSAAKPTISNGTFLW